MKFIALSDIHGQWKSSKLKEWFKRNPGDCLLFAGDLQSNHFDTGVGFIDWLHGLPYRYKVMTFGNHDGNWDWATEYAKQYSDITVLNNSSVEIEGIKIWGSPNSLIFLDWFFMKSDKELVEVYKNIPDDTDIVITHTPPFGILDMTKDGILTGSMSLLDRIKELKNLKYHVFGHIHEQAGTCNINPYSELKDINFINASVMNEKYQLVHDPIIFDITQ